MPCREPKLAPGSAIGLKLVRHEHAGSVAVLANELAHAPKSGCLVPPRLNQEIEDLPFAVDGAPQIHAPALDRDHHLVQVPGICRAGS